MKHTIITAQTGDKLITIETGKIAKQADGAVTVRLGETIVLVAAVAAVKAKPGQDFFPLTVDYRERAAAAGRFPGGYFKREGRPTEKEILTSRLTDRPIRPLFPKGMFNEVQVQSVLLSADGENDPDILSIIGASAALTVSDIPWDGPLGAVRIARVDGKFVVNPTHVERKQSDLDLVYVGNAAGDVVMYEGAAKEITEEDFNAALVFAQEACNPLIQAQKELAAKGGKAKRHIELSVVPDEILNDAKSMAGARMIPALLTPGKLARESACKAVADDVGAKLLAKYGAEKVNDLVVKEAFYHIQKENVRTLILNEGKRLDGRSFDQVRQIGGEVGILPRAHGSALFYRGETQAMTLATLGTTEDSQEFDSYTGGNSEEVHSPLQLPQFLGGRNRSYQRSGSARNWSRGFGGTFDRADASPEHLSLRHPYHQRDHGVEWLHLHGERLRWIPGTHGCGGSVDPSCGWNQHWNLHRERCALQNRPIQTSDGHHWLGGCLLRHGLQNRWH